MHGQHNQVVVHYQGGEIRKGFTEDFFPNKESFHLEDKDSGSTEEIQIADLKGVFFVKTFEGDKDRQTQNVERTGMGRKIQVDFKDGETLLGYTSGYSAGRASFFVFPADPGSNNERIFVVAAATSNVAFV